MKIATGLYLLGLFIFATAYSAFFKFIDRHQLKIGAAGGPEDMYTADGAFTLARRAIITSR